MKGTGAGRGGGEREVEAAEEEENARVEGMEGVWLLPDGVCSRTRGGACARCEAGGEGPWEAVRKDAASLEEEEEGLSMAGRAGGARPYGRRLRILSKWPVCPISCLLSEC